jgi:hypothetical protein
MEIFTGAGRRRSWSDEQKAAIVAESLSGREVQVVFIVLKLGGSHMQFCSFYPGCAAVLALKVKEFMVLGIDSAAEFGEECLSLCRDC